MDSKTMRCRIGLFVVVMLLGMTGVSWAAGAALTGIDEGAYVLRIYQRVVSIGIQLLKHEEEWIFSLKKERPLDLERVVARYRSAREQMRSLRKRAAFLEKRLPSSDPRLAKIQSLKAKLPTILQGHRKNIVILNKLAGGKLSQVSTMMAQACEQVESPAAVGSFPVTTVDEGF